MTLDEALSQAWADHAAQPAAVSARFDAWRALVAEPAQLAGIAALVVHVDGEHLGAWDRALDRLDALLRTPGLEAGSPTWGALWRSVGAMARCAGNEALLDRALAHAQDTGGLAGSHVARIEAVAAAAAIGQGRLADGIRWFEAALDAEALLPATDPAVRSIAITANNLAVSLEELPERSATQDALLLRAAREARRAWERAGTWMNVERAEYRLALAHAAVGRWDDAVAHAETCLRICEANGADAGERFFAHEARTRALHGAGRLGESRAAFRAAAACIDAVADPGFQAACREALAKLP